MNKIKLISSLGVFLCASFFIGASFSFSAPIAQADTTSNLILRYTLDDNAATAAVTNTGLNTMSGTASANTSVLHIPGTEEGTGAFALASSSKQYIDTNYTWSASDSQFTLSAWVKTTQTNDGADVFGSYNGQNALIQMGLTFQGYAFCSLRDSAGHSAGTPQNIKENNGKWHLLTCTNDGTSLKMYVDGTLTGSASATTLNGNYRGSSPRTLLIGQGGNNSGYVGGSIDDVRVYNRALSASDVDELAGLNAGLFGYWAFDEGSGTSAVDSSGNGNTGTLVNSPTWVAGKIGPYALDFVNGSSGQGSYISTPNQTQASHEDMTWAAWVYPTALTAQYGTNEFMSGTQWGQLSVNSDGYFHFTDRTPSDHAYTGASIPLNAWTHLAVTCSDSTGKVTMYVNGTQVKQDSNPSSCYNNFINKVYVGTYGPNPGVVGWTGYIDDARVYDGRALSSADIAALYAGGGPVSPVAPQISSVSASTTATTATITWFTDQSASSTVNYGLSTSYTNTSISDVFTTSHSVTLTGLTASTTYHFQVASGNSTGQVGISNDLTFTTQAIDVTPPVITAVASSTSFTNATVTWDTNEPADSTVWYGTTTGTYMMSTSSPLLAVSHSISISGLSSGTTYYFVVVSTDSSGNTATSSEYSLVTGTPDTTAPVISFVSALTAATTATISWTTDEPASSTVRFGLDSNYGNASTSDVLMTSHSIQLTGLMASTTYHFQVASADASGNASTSDDFTFTTDTTPGVTLCGGACITFHDGDVIPIVSDSITSIDLYSAYLESYFDLRYPNIHLHFRQTARSGAAIPNYTTGGQYMGQTNPLSPNVVELMMTNNGGFTTDQYMSQVDDFINNYVIATSSAQPVILDTPPMNTPDGSSLLAQYSAALTSYAQAHNIPFSPVFSYLHPIWAANLASSTPVDIQDGGDTDHMGPPAHLAIAYAYLRGFNADPNVSSATIDASTAQVTSETDAAISNVAKTAQGIDFTRLDSRLPMAYDDRSLPIFKIMPQIYDMNKYMLTVNNLDPGDYYVYIDGVPSGSASSDQLAAGWNMSTMTSGPIHDQLQEVLGRLRDKEGLDRVTRAVTPGNNGMIGYISNANGCYISLGLTGDALKNCLAGSLANMNHLDDLIYAAAQPTSHTFSLRKAVGAADTTPPVISNPMPSAPLPMGTATTTLSINTDENATCKYGTIAQTPYIWMPNTFTTTGGTTHSATISGLLDGVTYTYYVRCQDEYGNRDMSDYTLTFSVNADPNPVAYYTFDEGTGTVAADSSGNGHTATLIGSPAWVPGKVGPSALSFDGANDAVNIGDISDADGIGALTLVAWVKGTGSFAQGQGYTIVSKYASGQGPWSMAYSGASHVYSCGIVTANGNTTAIGPTIQLNDTNWHQVACVYNGTNVTVYTDGATSTNPSDSPALTGAVKDTTYPVCIGAISNGVNGCQTGAGTWNGTIDDVRIYKRALSATEIASLAAPDAIVPIISSVTATTTDTSALINWTTDENSSSLVNYGPDSSYGIASSSDVMTTAHLIALVGLTPGTLYHFKVVSTDASGNVASSSDMTFATGAAPDTFPPVISAITASTTSSSAIITWNTDEAGTSLVNYGTTTDYGSASSTDGVITSHSITLVDLSPSTAYHFQVVSADATGNTATSSDLVFTTSAAPVPPDTTAPRISSVAATTTDTTALISWNTDEAATSTIEYGTDASYGSASTSDSLDLTHSFMLQNLAPSTVYHFRVSSSDTAGNVATSSDMTFTTSATPDTSAPVISTIAASTTDSAAQITWNTNENSDSTVFYGTVSRSYVASSSIASLDTSHVINLSGLSAATTYYYVVASADASGNIATSGEQTFITSTAPDTTAPVITLIASSTGETTATITWNTDEAATSTIEFGTSDSYGLASSSDVLTTSHSITLSDLASSTTYHFRVSSADAAGNISTSSDLTFTTATPVPPPVQVISSIATSTTANTATISWVTGGSTTGATPARHSMILKGLSPGTNYTFQLVYGDDVGNNATSTDVTFTTTQ